MATLHVGPGGLASLGAASAKAQPGDIVEVAAGVYRERLQLTTPGVTWRSSERHAAIIDGGWGGNDYDDEFSIQVGIGAADIRFDGFAIRNCEGRAFVAGSKARGSVIENLLVDNCGTSAFVLQDAVGVTVRGVVATRLGMAWEAGRRPSVAGSVIMVRAANCVIEDCVVAYGHGEGINIGRGSRGCVVRGCVVFDNSHLCLYFNRCVGCTAEGNILFLTGETRRNAGNQDAWPAGVVFGDEGSENMQTNPHSAGNTFHGNLVVNAGTLLHVRNNRNNYDTLLDAETRITENSFIGGPLTRVGLALDPNEAGRGQHRALISGNVIDMSNAAGDTLARGVAGPRWVANAWSSTAPIGAGTAADVVGDLGLVDPGAALANEFPQPGHNLTLANYRPHADSPLVGAGPDGASLGALEPLPIEPPVDPPPPPPPPVWDALIERAAAVGVQLATQADALAAAGEAVGVASLAHDAAADELAALLTLLDELKQAG